MVHAVKFISILAQIAEEEVVMGNEGGLTASCLKHGVLDDGDVHQFPASDSFRVAADVLEELAARAVVTARVIRAAEAQAKSNEDALGKEAA
jgi:pantoate kinase